MMARSTCANKAVIRLVSPEFRPNNSITPMRSCEPIEVRISVIKLTERVTAVEKPMQ